jgi:hypothetical protein
MKHSQEYKSREAIGNAHLSVELLDAIVLLLDHPAKGHHFLLQSGNLLWINALTIPFLDGRGVVRLARSSWRQVRHDSSDERWCGGTAQPGGSEGTGGRVAEQ